MPTANPMHATASNDMRAHPLPCIASPRFLTVKEVASRLSVSVSTVWRLVQTEEGFPRPRRIAIRSTRWLLAEVEEYEASRRLTH